MNSEIRKLIKQEKHFFNCAGTDRQQKKVERPLNYLGRKNPVNYYCVIFYIVIFYVFAEIVSLLTV